MFYTFVISYYWISIIPYVCSAKGCVFQRSAWSIGRRLKLKWSCCVRECGAMHSVKPCGCSRGTFFLRWQSRRLALQTWLLKEQVSVQYLHASDGLQSIRFQIKQSTENILFIVNLLATDLDILVQPLCKVWILYKPKKIKYKINK
jgi:hypothetical protein